MARPFQNVIYIQIRRQWLGIQFLTFSGRYGGWAGVPEVVLARDRKGREQAYLPDDPVLLTRTGQRSFAAFNHPRSPLSGFDETEKTLRLYLKVAGRRKTPIRETFIIQVLDEWQGGITDVEWRALAQMASYLGAGDVIPVESRRELTPPDLIKIAKKGASGRLYSIPEDSQDSLAFTK